MLVQKSKIQEKDQKAKKLKLLKRLKILNLWQKQVKMLCQLANYIENISNTKCIYEGRNLKKKPSLEEERTKEQVGLNFEDLKI